MFPITSLRYQGRSLGTFQLLCYSLNPVPVLATKPCLGHSTPEEQDWRTKTHTKSLSSWCELWCKTKEHTYVYRGRGGPSYTAPRGTWGLHLWHTFFFFSQPRLDVHSYSVSYSRCTRLAVEQSLTKEIQLSTQATQYCQNTCICQGNVWTVAWVIWNKR